VYPGFVLGEVQELGGERVLLNVWRSVIDHRRTGLVEGRW
jgi:hypothetical protein